MKNIEKSKKWRILAGIAILGTLFACADHMLQDAGEQAPKSPKNQNEELTVSAAQQWFESNYAPVVATRSAGDQERLFKPHWDEAKEWNRMRYEVVETPVYTQGMHIILDSETETHWDPGKKNNFIRNNVRLVVLLDKKTGKTRSFMMTFVGTYEYLKKTRTIGKNGYLYRQPDFSGAVLFHELGGAFINGWRYSDGKIVATISRPTERKDTLSNSSSVATRAEHQVCHSVCYPVYDSYCDYSYVQSGDMESGIIYDIVENCYPTYSGYECTDECYTYDDGLDDRDDNWNGERPIGGAGDPPKKDPAKEDQAKKAEVLNKIYGDKSTLTDKEKQLLADALATMNDNKFWKKIYDVLDKNSKITFCIKSEIEGKSSGRYYTSEKAIAFPNDACINFGVLREELFHALQHQTYKKVAENASNKFTLEFEAHSFADIANALYASKYSEQGSNLLNPDSSPELINAVSDLMNSIIKDKCFGDEQYTLYEKAGKLWSPSGYTGSFDSSIQPLVLRNVLKK